MIPKQSEIEIPLLEVLSDVSGGQARPRDIYPLLQRKFPSLTSEDLEEKLTTGTPKWTNRVQWARQALVQKGEVSSPQYGLWAITEKGRARLATSRGHASELDQTAPANMVALHEEYVLQVQIELARKTHRAYAAAV